MYRSYCTVILFCVRLQLQIKMHCKFTYDSTQNFSKIQSENSEKTRKISHARMQNQLPADYMTSDLHGRRARACVCKLRPWRPARFRSLSQIFLSRPTWRVIVDAGPICAHRLSHFFFVCSCSAFSCSHIFLIRYLLVVQVVLVYSCILPVSS